MEGTAKFLGVVLDKCVQDRGMLPPFTVCIVSRDVSVFCVRYSGEGDGSAEFLCAHPDEEPKDLPLLPVTILVVDVSGNATHATVRVDDPDSIKLH